MWVVDKKSKTKNETWFVNKECSNSKNSELNPSDEVIEVIDLDDEDEDEDDGDKGNRVNVTPAQMVAAVCVSKRMNRRERDSKWQPMAELKFVQMLNNVENC